VFCIDIFLKIEYYEEGSSYMQRRHLFR